MSNIKAKILTKFNEFIDKKGLTEQKELVFYEVRDNIVSIILLFITIMLGVAIVLNVNSLTKDYEKKITQLNSIKKEIVVNQKKTQGNEKYRDFSEILQFGVKINDEYVPSSGYLSELRKLYPTKDSLNFGTFTEGWTSNFLAWRGERIRVPNDILKEYRVSNEEQIDANFKKVTYNLKLEGSEGDINKYLSVISGLKLVSEISEIKEKRKNDKEISTEVIIAFYLKN